MSFNTIVCVIVFISFFDFSFSTINGEEVAKLGSSVLNMLGFSSNGSEASTQMIADLVSQKPSLMQKISGVNMESLNESDDEYMSTKGMDTSTELSSMMESETTTNSNLIHEQRRTLDLLSGLQSSSQGNNHKSSMNGESMGHSQIGSNMGSIVDSLGSSSDQFSQRGFVTESEITTDSSLIHEQRTLDLLSGLKSSSSSQGNNHKSSINGDNMDHSTMDHSQMGSNMFSQGNNHKSSMNGESMGPNMGSIMGNLASSSDRFNQRGVITESENTTDSSLIHEQRTLNLLSGLQSSSQGSTDQTSMNGDSMDHSTMDHSQMGSNMGSNMNNLGSSFDQFNQRDIVPQMNSSLMNSNLVENINENSSSSVECIQDREIEDGMNNGTMNTTESESTMPEMIVNNGISDTIFGNERSIWDTLMGFTKENMSLPMTTLIPSVNTLSNEESFVETDDKYIPPLVEPQTSKSILGFPQRG